MCGQFGSNVPVRPIWRYLHFTKSNRGLQTSDKKRGLLEWTELLPFLEVEGDEKERPSRPCQRTIARLFVNCPHIAADRAGFFIMDIVMKIVRCVDDENSSRSRIMDNDSLFANTPESMKKLEKQFLYKLATQTDSKLLITTVT
ncbi:hypothetical protein AVEN_228159-1 [Araneus ventricosus]|uniref:Uncharacterized protein n=1 Tax=Araneus ventricosus TaxID=182803 RepID=A0A4Y2CVD5_ARAVE|nr:hypothetical protein AVEN_228159-1 [Araneus ventricosus]